VSIINFNDFINEASLKGNEGIPGEGKDVTSPSLLNWITISSDEESRRFEAEHRDDIRNMMGLVGQAGEIQRGHENELSQLAEKTIRKIFGSLIDDVNLDIKLVNPGSKDLKEMHDKMEEHPDPLEGLEDEGIIDEVKRRKILRTIQQGKGLNVKEIMNLPEFIEGLSQILGADKANTYLSLLNRISNTAQWYDWNIPIGAKESMHKNAPPGACELIIDKKEDGEEEDEEDLVAKILADLEAGKIDEDDMEDLIDEYQSTVRARAYDLGLLIHEAVKGVYKLITQASLMSVTDTMGLEASEIVKMNTESLFDEIEEQKFGKKIQSMLFKAINDHPDVKRELSKIDDETDIAAFLEQLHWLFFGKLALIQPAKKMLEIVNDILKKGMTGDEIRSRIADPLIKEILEDLEAEKEYQKSKETEEESEYEEDQDDEDYDEKSRTAEAPKDFEDNKLKGKERELSDLAPSEIEDLIDQALDRGDFKEVKKLSDHLESRK
jgi:hypothetical protein